MVRIEKIVFFIEIYFCIYTALSKPLYVLHIYNFWVTNMNM